jgi:hypothetical protein
MTPHRGPGWWADYALECAAAAGKTKRLREAKRFRTLAAALDKMAAEDRRLVELGGMLANAAFNIAQMNVAQMRTLDDRTRASLDDLRRRWDEGMEARRGRV